MATWRFVNINLKEAELLADLTGIQSDLQATDAMCDLLITELNKKPLDLHLTDALCTAVLVRYARSFKSGVRRTKIEETISTILSPELLNEHEWFLNLRDKYVAHSVNAFEDHQVVAYLVPEERGPRGISSISVQESRLTSISSADIENLKSICKKLLNHVGILIEREKERVLEAARQIPGDSLYSQKDPAPDFANKTDVAKSRKRK